MKILFFMASNSIWYKELYKSIKKGFEDFGCTVIGGHSLLNPPDLIKLIEKENPDFVFEHNRVKDEIPDFPENVIHFSWLVDFWGRDIDKITGSNIIYLWSLLWLERFSKKGFKNIKYLAPATDSTIYKSINEKKIYDFLFLGHISNIWRKEELNRKITNDFKSNLLFKNILPLAKEYLQFNDFSIHFKDFIEEKINIKLHIDKVLNYDICERAIRQTRREQFIDSFIEDNLNLTIFGSENWLKYDKYMKSYKGYISNPIELNREISKSWILLHDDNTPHFRIFDSMAAGTVVTCSSIGNSEINAWEYLGFTEGEDYFLINPYSNKNNLPIHNKSLLIDIAENAKNKVLKNHLWLNRAEQIINDYKMLKNLRNNEIE